MKTDLTLNSSAFRLYGKISAFFLLVLGLAPVLMAQEATPTGQGELIVDVAPAGAEVTVGTEVRGSTPLSLNNLAPGSYAVRVSREGFEEMRFMVDIVADETTIIQDHALPLLTGELKVRSRPEGLRYTLIPVNLASGVELGERLGTTPANYAALPLGDYQVVFEREGWESQERLVLVNQSRETVAQAVFPGGTLTLNSLPEGATVVKEGEVLGITPVTLHDLAPGEFNVQLILENHESAVAAAPVEIGQEVIRTVRLLPLNEIIPAKDLDEKPRPLRAYLDKVPNRLQGVNARVVLSLVIDQDGSVERVEVNQSNDSRMQEWLIDQVENWRFTEPKRRDRPVKTVVMVPFDFSNEARDRVEEPTEGTTETASTNNDG